MLTIVGEYIYNTKIKQQLLHKCRHLFPNMRQATAPGLISETLCHRPVEISGVLYEDDDDAPRPILNWKYHIWSGAKYIISNLVFLETVSAVSVSVSVSLSAVAMAASAVPATDTATWDNDWDGLAHNVHFWDLHRDWIVLLDRNWVVVMDRGVDGDASRHLDWHLDGHRLLHLDWVGLVHVDGEVFGDMDGVGTVNVDWVGLRDRDFHRPLNGDWVGLGDRDRNLSGDGHLGDATAGGTTPEAAMSSIPALSAVSTMSTMPETVTMTEILVQTALLLHWNRIVFGFLGEDRGGKE